MEIHRCDFNNTIHCQAVIKLMRDYMTDEMGGSTALSDEDNVKLIEGLKNLPTAFSLLAFHNGQYVGLTNSFINFSTFSVKKFLNIHDVIVPKEYRGLGIGNLLIEKNIEYAKAQGFGKVTLEVREDNSVAQHLYKKKGFEACRPNMYFWVRYIEN